MAKDSDVTSENLGDKIFEAAKTSFGPKFGVIKQFVRAESEKLAITLRMIVESIATGAISKAEDSKAYSASPERHDSCGWADNCGDVSNALSKPRENLSTPSRKIVIGPQKEPGS